MKLPIVDRELSAIKGKIALVDHIVRILLAQGVDQLVFGVVAVCAYSESDIKRQAEFQVETRCEVVVTKEIVVAVAQAEGRFESEPVSKAKLVRIGGMDIELVDDCFCFVGEVIVALLEKLLILDDCPVREIFSDDG